MGEALQWGFSAPLQIFRGEGLQWGEGLQYNTGISCETKCWISFYLNPAGKGV